MNIFFTGITGSLGQKFIQRMLKSHTITGIARHENAIYDLREKYINTNLSLSVGDVRDKERMVELMRGHEVVVHAAALKHVPDCEVHPMEAIKTNVHGTKNVIDAAIETGVEKVIIVSTDKAVQPINSYGMTKALAEKLAIGSVYKLLKTQIAIVRYGNVMMSRGSVIPLFQRLIRKGLPLTVTEPTMTRFLLKQAQAVDLINLTLNFMRSEPAINGRTMVLKAPACTILTLAEACWRIETGREGVDIRTIGPRSGEKMHECLVSEAESQRTEDRGSFYIIHPWDCAGPKERFEYTSANTTQLNVEQAIGLLKEVVK